MKKIIFLIFMVSVLIVGWISGKPYVRQFLVEKKISKIQARTASVIKTPARIATEVVEIPPRIVIKVVDSIFEEVVEILPFL